MSASTRFTSDSVATLSQPDGTVTGFILKPIDPADKDSTNCFWWDKFKVECVAVLRNSKGTAEGVNEFLWVNQGTRWSFSVVSEKRVRTTPMRVLKRRKNSIKVLEA